MGRFLKLGVGFAISGICLVLAFRRVPLQEIWAAIGSISARTLVAASLLGSATLWLRALRWRILLSSGARLDWWTAFRVNSAGQLGNFALPFRMGDFYRATNLGRAGFTTAFTLATVLVERILDAAFLVFIASVILVKLPTAPLWLARGANLVAIAAALGMAAVVILPRVEDFLPKIVSRNKAIENFVGQFMEGLRCFHRLPRAALFLILTAGIWMVDCFSTVVIARGLGINMAPFTAGLLLCSIALASAIPAAPGNLGVYQLVVVSILTLFGTSRDGALSLALVIQAMMLLVMTVWGLASFWSLAARNGARGYRVRNRSN